MTGHFEHLTLVLAVFASASWHLDRPLQDTLIISIESSGLLTLPHGLHCRDLKLD